MQFPWKKYGWQTTILACFIAVVHIYFFLSALIHKTYLTDDSVQYLTITENLAHSGSFSQSYSPPMVQDLQRTPGYPIFLLLLGRIPFLVLLLQHLLVFATAGLIYKIAASVYGTKMALAGTKLYLVQPYPILFASYFLSETLFVFLLVAGFWGYLRFWKGGGWPAVAFSLASLCLATLVRPVAFPLLIIAVLAAIIHLIWISKQRILQMVAAILVPISMLGPWMWRNHEVSGQWMLSSMGNMGMLHGRLGGLESWRSGKTMDEHHFYMDGDSIVAKEIGLPELRIYPIGKQTHETERLRPEVNAMTFTFFLQHPWDAFRFELHCIWEMLKGVGYGWAKELTLSSSIASISATLQLICNVLMYLGVFLACMRFRSWTPAEAIAFVSIVVILLVSAAAWADGRYRMVIDPFLMILTVFVLRQQEQRRA